MNDSEINALQARLEHFDNNGYHIVAMIGTAQSGKSSIICDMYTHFSLGSKRCAETINIGQMSQSDSTAWAQLYEDYRSKKQVVRTGADPFFVAMNASTESGTIKVAFLEVQGEMFEGLRDPAMGFGGDEVADGEDKYFRSIQSKRPITWLIVGNFESRSIANKRLNEDAILQITLDTLRSKRSTTLLERDNFLFILSKCDQLGPELGKNLNFNLKNLVRQRYPVTCNFLDSQPFKSRKFTHYTVGTFSPDGDKVESADDKNPRQIWNYLFEKALGESIYRDLVKPPPPPFWIKLLRKLAPAYAKSKYQ